MINPFSVLTSKIYGAVAIAAITFGAIQTVRIEGFWFITGYVEKLAERDATIKNLIESSNQAKAAQIAFNQVVADKQEQLARQSNEKQIITRYVVRNASNDYADRNRVHKVCPSISGGTDTAPEADIAEGDGGLPGDSVVVSKGDFDLFNEHTANSLMCGDWARRMVQVGLAVEGE